MVHDDPRRRNFSASLATAGAEEKTEIVNLIFGFE